MTKDNITDLNRPIFFRWLKNHNVFGRFKHYYNDWVIKKGSLDILKEPIGHSSVSAFYWGGTNEGSLFWRSLYQEWEDYWIKNNLSKK